MTLARSPCQAEATVTLPDGSQTVYTYQGNMVTVTDPAGKWKQYASDAFGNLRTVLEPDPTAQPVPGPPSSPPTYPVATAPTGMLLTGYTYDQLSHLTQVSMPRGGTTQTRTFAYDPTTQRLASATNPENGAVSYTYNPDGSIASKTAAASSDQETYSYDSYGRLTTIHRFPGGGSEDNCQLQTFRYNAAGAVSEADYGTTQYPSSCGGPNLMTFRNLFSYTPAGKVTGKSLYWQSTNHYFNSIPTYKQITASYTYDAEGAVTSVAYPSVGGVSQMTYSYTLDAMERPTALTDSNSNSWTSGVTYNAANQIMGGTFGSGLQPLNETRSYNSLFQLNQVTQVQGGTTVLNMTYNYPTAGLNNGQMTQSADAVNGETITYQYDALKRLSTASSTLGWAASYTYDGFGNLTQMTPTQGSAPYLSVAIIASTNHITGASYDLNGNMNNVAGHSLGYDVANRLVTVGGNFAYAYAANNERVYYRSTSGTDTIYLYGAFGEKLATYTVSGYQGSEIMLSQQSTNVYFAGRLVTAEGNLVSTDLVGSVRWSAAGSGTARTYFPYGTEYATTGNDTEKYATYTRDSLTGLDYAVNRYYYRAWGRFLSPDPYRANNGASGDPAEPGSWNRYAYGGGDPVNRMDPDGMRWVCVGWTDDSSCYEIDDPIGGGSAGASDPSGSKGFMPKDPAPAIPKLAKANKKQQKMFKDAIERAVSRIRSKAFDGDCGKLFGGEAGINTLLGATYSLEADPAFMRFPVPAATTFAALNSVIINLAGPFLFPVQNGADYRAGTSLEGVEFQAFLLLHELGHLTGAYKDKDKDADNPQYQRDNNNLVLEDCFGKTYNPGP